MLCEGLGCHNDFQAFFYYVCVRVAVTMILVKNNKGTPYLNMMRLYFIYKQVWNKVSKL